MKTYNLNEPYKDLNKDIEADLITLRNKNEVQDFKYNYLKMNYEGVLKNLIAYEEKNKKKFNALRTKKGVSITASIIAEILGVTSGITMTATGVASIAGMTIIRVTNALFMKSIIFINEYIALMRERYARLRTFTNSLKIQYENLLKKSMIDGVIDEKEATNSYKEIV